MPRSLKDILELFDLDDAGHGTYIGAQPDDNPMRVYGGQVVAQAMMAATRTVPDRKIHSVHASFLRPATRKPHCSTTSRRCATAARSPRAGCPPARAGC